jgi:hypothetical protein
MGQETEDERKRFDFDRPKPKSKSYIHIAAPGRASFVLHGRATSSGQEPLDQTFHLTFNGQDPTFVSLPDPF